MNNVILYFSERPTVEIIPWKIIVSIGGVILFILVTILFIYKMYGPQISLYCKSRVPWSSLSDKGEQRQSEVRFTL